MADQFQNNFTVEDQMPKRNRFKAVIIAACIGSVVIGLAAVLFFWPKKQAAVPVAQQSPETPANVPPAVPPISGVQKPADIPAIEPGMDRPLTAAEKQKYGFSATDDIWMRSSSPTDGSQPAVSFYNKTVNPNPYPTVPVVIHGD